MMVRTHGAENKGNNNHGKKGRGDFSSTLDGDVAETPPKFSRSILMNYIPSSTNEFGSAADVAKA